LIDIDLIELPKRKGGRRDRLVVAFTTTSAIGITTDVVG
jgi:hypothetical protein